MGSANFTISRAHFDEIVAHSREDLPNECCGMVAGADGKATRVLRARNELASPFSYAIDARDQIRIIGEIEDAGEQLAAIYHSHTKSEAYPSQTDINLAANWPDPVYLICSLADPAQPVIRAFEIREGQVNEVGLSVDDDG
jgi:proteasome lid subunit RPN8/RPN11